MLLEITQIKRWLAATFHLRTEGDPDAAFAADRLGYRILDPVPEGTYVIPIGRTLTPTYVTITDDRIHIGDEAPPTTMESTS